MHLCIYVFKYTSREENKNHTVFFFTRDFDNTVAPVSMDYEYNNNKGPEIIPN